MERRRFSPLETDSVGKAYPEPIQPALEHNGECTGQWGLVDVPKKGLLGKFLKERIWQCQKCNKTHKLSAKSMGGFMTDSEIPNTMNELADEGQAMRNKE